MGIFDFLTGTKAPPAGGPREDVTALRKALLGLNRMGSPWQVRDGAAEGCDLVAEWKIVDARWYEIFAKAGLKSVFQILMRFDAERGEVRSVDREYTVEWRAGVPALALSAEAFRGQKVEMSFGTAIGFREDLSPGVIYEYRFRTGEMKTPLKDTAANSGWGWKGVAFGKL